jgi:hypothetical protein
VTHSRYRLPVGSTFQNQFYDSGAGVLADDLSVFDDAGNLLHTWTLSDPTDIIGTTVGGNRYGWLIYNQSHGWPLTTSFGGQAL